MSEVDRLRPLSRKTVENTQSPDDLKSKIKEVQINLLECLGSALDALMKLMACEEEIKKMGSGLKKHRKDP